MDGATNFFGNETSTTPTTSPGQGGSNTADFRLSASADFILYLAITAFFVLTCTIADRRRRRRLGQLDEAAAQLREMRRQQYIRNHGPTRTSPRNNPEQQKEEILNALILRTVTIADVTLPAEEAEEEKAQETNKTTTRVNSSRLSSFFKRSNHKRGLLSSFSSSTRTLQSTSSGPNDEGQERKRSVLLIRRRTLSERDNIRAQPPTSLAENDRTTFSDSMRTEQTHTIMRNLEEGIAASSEHDNDTTIHSANTATCMCDPNTSEELRNQCRSRRRLLVQGATSARSILPLVDEEREHGESINVAPNSDEESTEDTSSSLQQPQQTEVVGMLLLEEGDNDDDDDKQKSSSSSSKEQQGGRLADATCSICLLGYEEGDKVAWSRNPKCNHAFHEECLVPWLMTHDECPNCRNNYFVFEAESNKHAAALEETPTLVSDENDEDEYPSVPSDEHPTQPSLTPEERV